MPFDQITWCIVSAITASLMVVFWDDIREEVATWLREHGLTKSVLMDAWIKLNQIKDADIRAELEHRGYVQRNIMSQIQ